MRRGRGGGGASAVPAGGASTFPTRRWRRRRCGASADVRWQMDKADISTLPSAKEQEAYLRPQIYEGDMQKVMKLYPGTQVCGAGGV